MRLGRWQLQDLTELKAHVALYDVNASLSLSRRRSGKPDRVEDCKMGMQDIITTKLMAAFAPQSLHVEDESHLHQGHAGHRPGGESHYRLYIVAEAFRGKSRLERHRMINAALANELKSRVHALAIHAQAPGESG
jgi:BolA protein